MMAKSNGFNYALTLERDIFLLVSQPTYRRHLSILKRGESMHQKERNTLTKCHSVLIKVHSAPKLQHMFDKRKTLLYETSPFFGGSLKYLAVKKYRAKLHPSLVMTFNFLKRFHMVLAFKPTASDMRSQPECFTSRQSRARWDKCGLQMFSLFFGECSRRHAREVMQAELRTAQGHEYFTCSMCESVSALEKEESIFQLSHRKRKKKKFQKWDKQWKLF